MFLRRKTQDKLEALQIFFILIQSSTHRIQRNPKKSSKKSPRIFAVFPSDVVNEKQKDRREEWRY